MQVLAAPTSAPEASLSSKPVPSTDNRPLRAKVYEKNLTGIQQSIILAMLEIGDSTGQHLFVSVPRIAAWIKCDEKSVQRAIWGDHRKHPGQPRPKREKGQPDKECPFCPDSLLTRRVLHQVAPANWKKHRPAQYELILDLVDDSDDVRSYLDQKELNFPPAEKRPTVASPQRPTVAPPSDPRSLAQRPTVAPPSDPRSHDSKAFDSRALDSKEFDPTSSSGRDDDVGLKRVIRAFEQSPVTNGKAKPCDWSIAQQLLELWSPKQIEYVILLATARRLASQILGKVASMAYFSEALQEPGVAKDCSASYTDYLRSVIARQQKREHAQSSGGPEGTAA